MGHHIETRYLPVEGNEKTSTNALLSEAVSDWYDNDNFGRGNSNEGYGVRTDVMTAFAAHRYIEANHSQVANDSVVIPIISEEDEVITTKKVKMTVSASAVKAVQNGYPEYESEQRAVEAYGLNVTSAEIVKVPAIRKAVAAATEGKSLTLYRIISHGNIIAKGFESQASARAEAIRLVNSDAPSEKRYTDLTVGAYVIREGGNDALVTISRPVPTEVEVDVLVKFTTIKPGAKASRYMVAFDYHS
jgi:hypothetical protein